MAAGIESEGGMVVFKEEVKPNRTVTACADTIIILYEVLRFSSSTRASPGCVGPVPEGGAFKLLLRVTWHASDTTDNVSNSHQEAYAIGIT